MKREPGYYWTYVNEELKWQISYWHEAGHWITTASMRPRRDDEFWVISEKQIECPFHDDGKPTGVIVYYG